MKLVKFSVLGKMFLNLILSFCFLFVPELKSAPLKIEKTGIDGAQWRQLPNGLLVYGRISDGKEISYGKGFEVDLYDQQLHLIKSYSKITKNFSIDFWELFYLGNNDIEFTLNERGSGKRIFIRLDANLKEVFVSAPFSPSKERDDSVFLFNYRHLSKTISYYRQDNVAWEIRNDSVNNGKIKSVKTFLRMSKEVNLETFPAFQQVWKIEISPAVPEYTRFLFSKDGRIYFYVNFKTETGEQYLYCLQNSDGKLIYKTKLSLAGTQACIYSNYFNDSINKKIILSGTCFYPAKKNAQAKTSSRGLPGIFLMEINESGKIIGSYNELYRSFNYPKPDSAFNKNFLTDSRFVSMKPNEDGSFSVFMECYAQLTKKEKTKDGIEIKLADSSYHYFMLEEMTFKISPTTINLICSNCVIPKQEYNGEISTSGIGNFDPLKRHVADTHYPDNINSITDANYLKSNFVLWDAQTGKPIFTEIQDVHGNSFFVGSTYNDTTKQTKTLLVYSFVSSDRFSNNYLSSETSGQNNFAAFQHLAPLANQDVNVEGYFFVRDSKTLFRISYPTNTSYKIEIVGW
jgi:hypothetical protein